MDGALDAIDAATGGKPWTHRLDGLIGGSPAVADGDVYVAATVRPLVALASYNRRCLMSRYLRMITPATSGRVASTGPGPATEHFAPDYASWRAQLAWPGSRFESAQSASPPVVQSDAVTHPAASAGTER
jgi:hypothetical protein